MFGLEKDKAPKKFDFDLELEIKKDPTKGKQYLKGVNENIHEIKQLLREGKSSQKELDDLGILLHGYSALERVLTRVVKSS